MFGDFSDVRWIAEAYTKLLSSPIHGLSIVNLCSGNLICIREVIDTLQKITGNKLNIEIDDALVRQADIKRQCGNNNKIFELLPTLSSPIAFKDTLNWMLKS